LEGSAIQHKQQSVLNRFHKTTARYLTQPMIRLLARTPVSPTILTWIGFLLAVGAAALIVTGHLFTAGLVVLIAGLFDILDGALARYKDSTSSFGAFLDSFLDRISEAVIMLGLLGYYTFEQIPVGVFLVTAALLGSLLVSYVRARAEALGVECQCGMFTRPERVIVLAVGLLLSQINYVLVIALSIITLFSFFTVVERVIHVWQQLKIK
jgi:CDP-diacylglycerol--glycerol-3-phosphate 3-phosphatidyltransferase